MASFADYFSGRKNPAEEGVVGKAVSGRKRQLDEAEAAALGQQPPPPQPPQDPAVEEARKKALIRRLRGE